MSMKLFERTSSTWVRYSEYEPVYLPKNHFIKEENLSTVDYLNLFFPFNKLDIIKCGVESMWNIQNDRIMLALAITMSGRPIAVNMSFHREYEERFD